MENLILGVDELNGNFISFVEIKDLINNVQEANCINPVSFSINDFNKETCKFKFLYYFENRLVNFDELKNCILYDIKNVYKDMLPLFKTTFFPIDGRNPAIQYIRKNISTFSYYKGDLNFNELRDFIHYSNFLFSETVYRYYDEKRYSYSMPPCELKYEKVSEKIKEITNISQLKKFKDKKMYVNFVLCLPKVVDGDLNLKCLSEFEYVVPYKVNGNLYIDYLDEKNGIENLPKIVNGNICLKKQSISNLTLPKIVDGNLKLSILNKLENVTFPVILTGRLKLNTKDYAVAKDIIFSQILNYSLDLNKFLSIENIKFPEVIVGDLNLENLTSAEYVKLPKIIIGNLYLNNLIVAEDLEFPQKVTGNVYLNNLTSMNGIILPKKFEYQNLHCPISDEFVQQSENNKKLILNKINYLQI